MSMKKVLVLVMVISVLAVSASATFAASKKNAAAPATADSVGIVDRSEVFFNHPKFQQTRQQVANLSRQKESEAKAAADKETDTTKKAQVVMSKRAELDQEEQKLLAPLYHDCEQAVREVAVKKKLTLVLEKSVVLIGGIDITQDVIQQLAKNK